MDRVSTFVVFQFNLPEGLTRAVGVFGRLSDFPLLLLLQFGGKSEGALGKATETAPNFILARSRPLSRLIGSVDRSC